MHIGAAAAADQGRAAEPATRAAERDFPTLTVVRGMGHTQTSLTVVRLRVMGHTQTSLTVVRLQRDGPHSDITYCGQTSEGWDTLRHHLLWSDSE